MPVAPGCKYLNTGFFPAARPTGRRGYWGSGGGDTLPGLYGGGGGGGRFR